MLQWSCGAYSRAALINFSTPRAMALNQGWHLFGGGDNSSNYGNWKSLIAVGFKMADSKFKNFYANFNHQRIQYMYL